MSQGDPLVLLAHAPNSAIAGMWASQLEASGIIAYIPGTYLIYHFEPGNQGTDVF